jgi:uncharacterized protein YjiS (DUF1127 family)
LDAIFEMLGAQTEEERQIEELNAMNDHELADLGIARDQIAAVVAERAGPQG